MQLREVGVAGDKRIGLHRAGESDEVVIRRVPGGRWPSCWIGGTLPAQLEASDVVASLHFVVDRGLVIQGGVSAAGVVEALDVVDDGELGLVAGGEAGAVEQLALEGGQTQGGSVHSVD